jgi:hypothetical protein
MLSELRVFELEQLIAGPFAGQLLRYVVTSSPLTQALVRYNGGFNLGVLLYRQFGAEIIKVDLPRSLVTRTGCRWDEPPVSQPSAQREERND